MHFNVGPFCESDPRRCSLVLVDSSWTNVKDLQDHIQNLFNLKDISLLTEDGCYLPPKESIKVVKSTQSLKAFQFEVATIPNEELADPSCHQLLAETSRKRKNRSLETETELTCSTPNLPKRSKCKNRTKDEITFVEPATNTVATNELSKKSTKGIKSKRQSEAFHENGNATDISNIQYDDLTDRTSISAGPAATILTPLLSSSQSESKQLQTISSAAGNCTSIKSQSSPNKHIIYEDDEVEVEPANVTAMETSGQTTIVADEVEFRCPLLELDCNVVRIFKLPRQSDPVKILEDIVISPTKSIVMAAEQSPEEKEQTHEEPLTAETTTASLEAEVVEKETTETSVPRQSPERVQLELESPKEIAETKSEKKIDRERPAKKIAEKKSEKKVDGEKPIKKLAERKSPRKIAEQTLIDSDSDSDDIMVLDDTNLDVTDISVDIIADMLLNAAPLTDLPNVSETIIFKLPRSKGAMQPAPNTSYIAGTCTYVNRRTKAITISVIASGSGIDHVLRQYSRNLDDSSDSMHVINVNFKNLIDAKVIVASVD